MSLADPRIALDGICTLIGRSRSLGAILGDG